MSKDSFAYLCAVLLLIGSVATLIALPSTANAQSNDPILEVTDYNYTYVVQYPQGLPSPPIQRIIIEYADCATTIDSQSPSGLPPTLLSRIIIEYADTVFQVDMQTPQGLAQPDAPRITIEYADCALTVDVALYLGPQPTGENDTRPPEIGVLTRIPESDVLEYQDVTVSVDITDVDGGVKNATLQYSLNDGAEWLDVPMTLNLSGYTNSLSVCYHGVIPGQPYCTWVRFRVVAYDFAWNTASREGDPPYGPYHVIPEFSSITLMLVLAILSLSAAALAKNIHRARRRSRIAI